MQQILSDTRHRNDGAKRRPTSDMKIRHDGAKRRQILTMRHDIVSYETRRPTINLLWSTWLQNHTLLPVQYRDKEWHVTGSGEKRKLRHRKRRKKFITVTFTVKKIVTVTAKIFYHRHRKKIIFLYFLKENSSNFFKNRLRRTCDNSGSKLLERYQKISKKAS